MSSDRALIEAGAGMHDLILAIVCFVVQAIVFVGHRLATKVFFIGKLLATRGVWVIIG